MRGARKTNPPLQILEPDSNPGISFKLIRTRLGVPTMKVLVFGGIQDARIELRPIAGAPQGSAQGVLFVTRDNND